MISESNKEKSDIFCFAVVTLQGGTSISKLWLQILISMFTKPLHFKKKPNQISASFSKELNLPKSSSFFAGLVVSDFSYSSAVDCDAVNNMNEVSSSEFKAFKALGPFMQPVNNNWLSNLTSQPVRNWIIISSTAVFLRNYVFYSEE